MDKLNAIRLFVNVCQVGSFARAAQIRGCSPSTVSKAIDRLEQDLQSLLFFRSTRKLTLTESGKKYLATTQLLLEQLNDCESVIAGNLRKPTGTLCLNIPVPFGRIYVQPMLSEFSKTYPEIQLNVQYSDTYVDMIDQGIDITIRAGKLNDSRLIGRKLSPLYLIICASPSYIEKYGYPAHISEFQQYSWIRLRFPQSGKILSVMVSELGEIIKLDPGRQIIVDNGESLAELCVDGAGLAQLPHFSAKKFLQSGDLVPLYPSIESAEYAVHALYAKQHKAPVKIKLFIDFLKQHLKQMDERPNHSWAAEIQPLVD